MCTMISQQIKVSGSGKAGAEWLKVDTASISYDHPFDMALEYSLNIDFTNEAGARLAVELDETSGRALVEAIQEVMRQAEKGGFVSNPA